MGVTDRQVRRMLQRVREEGDRGIVHGNRGRPSPHKIPKVRGGEDYDSNKGEVF